MSELTQNLWTYLTASPLLAYLAVFVGGVLTSFEPCIYTMLPITSAFIANESGGSRVKGLLLGIVYVLGIAITYSTLGAVAALTGTVFGEITTEPLLYLIMGNICIVLGLSNFDLFKIGMPAFLVNLQTKRIGKGFIMIFFLGIFSGFVIGPCTAAVLGVTLAYVASKQNVFFGISLLFTFSMGMGVIIILLAAFTGFLLALPKAGVWMEKIRKFLGFVLIAIGEYFIFRMGQYSI